MKVRLLYISSFDNRWTHLEWVCQDIDRTKFDLSFLLLSLTGRRPYMEGYLRERGIPFLTLSCKLSPAGIFRAVREVRRHCRAQRIEVVHTHIFFASLVGLLGAFLARVPVRINTRHHAVPNHGKPAIWLDHLANRLATRIVVTSELLRRVLVDLEKVPPEKVRLIHLGIDLERFRDAPPELARALAAKHNPAGSSPVIGVIARHIESKGIQYVVPAFQRLLEHHPSAVLILAYAVGPYRKAVEELLAALSPERYVLIPFEENVFALYKTFDVCVHVPVGEDQESFGLVFLEALAAGVPSIFTLSGVGRELLEHRRNAWLVDYRNSDQIYEGMVALLADAELRGTLAREGLRSVDPAFSHTRMVRALEDLYQEERRGRLTLPLGEAHHAS